MNGRATRAVALTALAMAASVAFAACDDESAGPEAGVTFQDVVEDTGDRFVGRTVTVSARVDEVVAPATFWLGEDTEERLLVVSAEEVQPDQNIVVEGSYVEVTGEVRDLNTREVVSESGVPEEELETSTEENYLRADDVELVSDPG